MSSLLSAELAATCNALGSLDKRTGKYYVDEFTLDTVKDLIRYLRRDDDDHEIRIHLGETKVLETDILPILINHSENKELFDVTLRLAVNLTNPPLLLYREEIPKTKITRRTFLQLISHLHSYKANAFTKPDIWTVLTQRISKILEIDPSERDDDSGLIVERILILVRNILHVPASDVDEKRPDNDASVHDQVLWALNQSGLLDIILYMSSENEKPYFMHILEIISLALREQNPTSLANAALQRSVDEKLKDEQELLAIRSEETKKRSEKVKHFSANRHSRFGGTFVVQNMKSISENSMICHKPLNNINSLDFDSHKSRFKKHKKLQDADDVSSVERRSAFAIRLFLKEFCIEFLNASYNTMMYYVKDVLVRSKAQKNDETYYLWAMKFFMEFNRNYNFQVKLVSETMSVSIFHYVQQQMEKYGEMMALDKGKASEWLRRLHLALKAYHELLLTMMAMDKSEDKSVRDSAKVIKSNIFYVLEYREFILHMINSFDETKMPRAFLKDLIETVHIFLKMLEQFCKHHGLVVQKKVRSKGKKKSKPKAAAKPAKKAPKKKAMSEEMKNKLWEAIDLPLFEMLQDGEGMNTDLVPFDAALEKDIEEQKGDCTKKIQKLLSSNKLQDAVGLLRAARDVWPENDIFGSSSVSTDEEISILKMIFMANIGAEEIDLPEPVGEENQEDDDNDEDNADEEDDEEEADRPSANIVEADFDFMDFIKSFCNPKVVNACGILLKNYEKNSTETNHCIAKILHRVAWDCKTPGILFQASIFRTFQGILGNTQDRFKELHKFAIFIVRKFTEVALKNPKVFAELLFWKNSREAYEIEEGYQEDGWNKKGKVAWTEEQEEELRKLYNENQSNPTNECDVIDWILDNLIEKNRSRKGVIKKLKEMGLIFRAPTRKSTAALAKGYVKTPFTEEEDEELKGLWTTYESVDDPLPVIMTKMTKKRTRKQIVERLLTLGCIHSKRECFKKSSKSDRNKKNKEGEDNPDSDVSDVSSSEDSDDSSQGNRDTRAPSRSTEAKKRPTPQVSNAVIIKSLIACVEQGLTEPLKWVIESLEEVALDQEAEGFDPEGEGVPLVPITAPCIEAMENTLFQDTLRCIGVNSPFDEQETYWRIPANIRFESLRKRCETITKAIEGSLVVPEGDAETVDNMESENILNKSQSNRSRKVSSSDDDGDELFNKLKSYAPNTNSETNKSNKNNKKENKKRVKTPNTKSTKKQTKHSKSENSKDSTKKYSKGTSRDESMHSSSGDESQHNTTVSSKRSPRRSSVSSGDESRHNTTVSSKRSSRRLSASSEDESRHNTIVSSKRSSRRSSASSGDESRHNTTVSSKRSSRHSSASSGDESHHNTSVASKRSSRRSSASSGNESRHNSTISSKRSSRRSSAASSRDESRNDITITSKGSPNSSRRSSINSGDESHHNTTVSSQSTVNNTVIRNTADDSGSESDSNNVTVIPRQSLGRNKRKAINSDSDESNSSKDSNVDSPKPAKKLSQNKKKKIRTAELDSESDADEVNGEKNKISQSNKQQSDSEAGKENHINISNSVQTNHPSEDSDDSTSIQKSAKTKKRKAVILSDDSDEDVVQRKETSVNPDELFDSLLN